MNEGRVEGRRGRREEGTREAEGRNKGRQKPK
jgi:hypothetical protein